MSGPDIGWKDVRSFSKINIYFVKWGCSDITIITVLEIEEVTFIKSHHNIM